MLLTGAVTNWIQPYLCAAQKNQEVLMLTNYALFTAKLTRVFGVYDKVATVKQRLEKLYQQGSARSNTAKFSKLHLAWSGENGLELLILQGAQRQHKRPHI